MAGKDKVSRWMRAWVGPFDLSGDARIFGTLQNAVEEVENTGWDDEYHRFISSDLRMTGVQGFQAILNDATNRSFPELTDLAENEFAIMFGSGAEPAKGDAAYMLPAIQMMDAASFDAGIAAIDTNWMADSAQYAAAQYNPFGVMLHDKSQETATIDGVGHDWGTAPSASTSLGGWGMLLVYATGGTWVLKIQDSIDNAAFADLITFSADGSTVVGEVAAVTGNVDRFTRIQYTRTGGNVDAVCLFARNY